MPDLATGDIAWVRLDLAIGRERDGRRPAVVVSSRAHLAVADTLVTIVPVTGVDRGWSNHVLLRGEVLPRASWAMTEQVRTISRDRVAARAGRSDAATLADTRAWIADFTDD
ncbi:MAG: type II toxin-antitoxin system PemK/MazF family toxin [Microbacterium sp.]